MNITRLQRSSVTGQRSSVTLQQQVSPECSQHDVDIMCITQVCTGYLGRAAANGRMKCQAKFTMPNTIAAVTECLPSLDKYEAAVPIYDYDKFEFNPLWNVQPVHGHTY